VTAEALGRFTLSWTLQDLSAQAGACQAAPALVERRPIVGNTAGAGDKFSTSCAGGDTSSTGPDRIFRFALPARATVRVSLMERGFEGALALRKACADGVGGADVAELACEVATEGHHPAVIERTLEAGTYWIVVDGQSPADQGTFTLDYRVVR
jgi:hypothetical protein